MLIKVDYASYGAGDAHAVDDNFEVSEYPEGLGLVATGKVVEVGKNVEGLKEGDEVSGTRLWCIRNKGVHHLPQHYRSERSPSLEQIEACNSTSLLRLIECPR